ncbi:hypothetical protein [Planctomycetes bacterium TBK1r]|uniref:Uncharacterized protein n=1 Tax=Stieleria magnilauensis TaxID=2527963 RepID=A0ABX5XPN2_9BACT|nr:hypothetical protein TBK1r_18620 [Planctomycetes bacterium TBK1r]
MISRVWIPRRTLLLCAVFAAALGVSREATAGIMLGKPDIELSQLTGSFDDSTGTLLITGTAARIVYTETPLTFERIYKGTGNTISTDGWMGKFQLTAKFDASGNLIPDSASTNSTTFRVEGAPSNADSAVTLLAGSLTELRLESAVHFDPSADSDPSNDSDPILYKLTTTFLASSTGGTKQSDFGTDLVVNIVTTATSDSFLTSFQISAGGGDVAAQAVPELCSFSCWAIGCTCLLGFRRNRRRLS